MDPPLYYTRRIFLAKVPFFRWDLSDNNYAQPDSFINWGLCRAIFSPSITFPSYHVARIGNLESHNYDNTIRQGEATTINQDLGLDYSTDNGR